MSKAEKKVLGETRALTQHDKYMGNYFKEYEEQMKKREIKKSEIIRKPYERSDDKEAKTFISERIDIDGLVNKLESQVFTVKTKELYDDSETHENARDLLWAIARLVYELKERILDYDSIIGDDVSGRLPSLILRKLINRKRKERGEDPIPIYFVAAGRAMLEDMIPIQRSAVRNFIESKEDDLGLKTLVSTEYLKTGRGIEWLLGIIDDQGLDYDVSAVGVFPEFNLHAEGQDILRDRLIYGSVGSEGAFLYGKLAAGVEKPHMEWFGGKMTPHSKRKVVNAGDEKEGYTTKDMKTEIKAARKDINLIVEEMYKLLED